MAVAVVDDVWAGDKSGAGRRGEAGGGQRVFFLAVRPVEGRRGPAPTGPPACIKNLRYQVVNAWFATGVKRTTSRAPGTEGCSRYSALQVAHVQAAESCRIWSPYSWL